jgi:hypothetical protein
MNRKHVEGRDWLLAPAIEHERPRPVDLAQIQR